METTKTMVMKILAYFKSEYGSYNNLNKEEMQTIVDVWYSNLREYPAEVIKQAVFLVVRKSKTKPTLAHIIEQIENMEQATGKSDQELWNELDKQSVVASFNIARFDYTYIPIGETKTQGELAREEVSKIYDGLDPLIKEYLGNSKKRFFDIAKMSQDEIQFEMARFLKAMPQVRQRQKIKQETPENVFTQLVEKTTILLEDKKN